MGAPVIVLLLATACSAPMARRSAPTPPVVVTSAPAIHAMGGAGRSAPTVAAAAALPPYRAYATGLAGAVALVPTPDAKGFFVLDPDGTVHGFGDAATMGNARATA